MRLHFFLLLQNVDLGTSVGKSQSLERNLAGPGGSLVYKGGGVIIIHETVPVLLVLQGVEEEHYFPSPEE